MVLLNLLLYRNSSCGIFRQASVLWALPASSGKNGKWAARRQGGDVKCSHFILFACCGCWYLHLTAFLLPLECWWVRGGTMQTCLCLPPWQWLLGLQLFKTHKMSALGAVWFERGSAFTLGFYSAFPKPCTPAPGLLLLKGKPSCCLILTSIRSQSRLLNTF